MLDIRCGRALYRIGSSYCDIEGCTERKVVPIRKLFVELDEAWKRGYILMIADGLRLQVISVWVAC